MSFTEDFYKAMDVKGSGRRSAKTQYQKELDKLMDQK